MNKQEKPNEMEEIIVTLTSYPARYECLDQTIESLFHQTLQPNRIILNIYKEEVNDILLEKMKRFIESGLEIYICEENIKPHKKYYYTLKNHPNAVLITVDDDCIYPENFVKELYQTHLRFPNTVVGSRGHRILYVDGVIAPYRKWVFMCKDTNQPSKSLLATGVGGVLYPAHCFHEDVLDMEALKRLAGSQDDLWLKIMEIRNGIPTVFCEHVWENIKAIEEDKKTGLWYENMLGDSNDKSMVVLLKEYGITEKDFQD